MSIVDDLAHRVVNSFANKIGVRDSCTVSQTALSSKFYQLADKVVDATCAGMTPDTAARFVRRLISRITSDTFLPFRMDNHLLEYYKELMQDYLLQVYSDFSSFYFNANSGE